MRPDDRVRILHMIEAAETVQGFLVNRSRSELDSDRMFLFAVLRGIEILGEAASRVSDETQESAPDIPWFSIVGMRNRLVHGYFDIDTELVWKTVTEEVAPLLSRLRDLIHHS